MQDNSRFICVGEILWDHLPDTKVAGGAPFNVAVHLKRWGCNVDFISSVGKDWDGDKLLNFVKEEKLSTKYINVQPEHVTGKVYVKLSDAGKPEYDIVEPVAWDYIEIEDDLLKSVTKNDYVVFGTLARRNEVSRNSIERLLNTEATKVFDANFREPYYDRELLEKSLQATDILKLNDDELIEISKWFGLSGDDETLLRKLHDKFNIKRTVLTRGEKGAVTLKEGKLYFHPGYKLRITDTVGAGDSFLAAYLAKMNETIPEEERLAFANAVGAFVATRSGALPEIELYYINRLLEEENNI